MSRHAAVFLHEVEAIGRDEQPVAVLELQDHEVPVDASALRASQAGVPRDPVVDVHDQVADLEVAEVGQERGAASGLALRHVLFLAEDLALRVHRQLLVRELEPFAKPGNADRRVEAVLGEDLREPGGGSRSAQDAKHAHAA